VSTTGKGGRTDRNTRQTASEGKEKELNNRREKKIWGRRSFRGEATVGKNPRKIGHEKGLLNYKVEGKMVKRKI